MKSFEQYMDEDGLFLNEEDKKKLSSYSEVERERILYERWTELQRVAEKKQLMEQLGKVEKEEPAKKAAPALHMPDAHFLVRRPMLVQAVFKPFFPIFKGCFVRAKIGSQYYICKIAGFSTGEPYPLPESRGMLTNTYLTIDIGDRLVKNFDLRNVSSGKMEPSEFDSFVKTFGISSLSPLNDKYKRVSAEMSRELTDEEITQFIAAREKVNPKKKTEAQQKIDLILKRDQAMEANKREEASRYQKELEEIEDRERARQRMKESEELEEMKKKLRNRG